MNHPDRYDGQCVRHVSVPVEGDADERESGESIVARLRAQLERIQAQVESNQIKVNEMRAEL